jgi:hypothetical protein
MKNDLVCQEDFDHRIMECVADHCASDVLVSRCETSVFFYGRDRPKDNGAIRGLFISWEKVGNHY